jgi:hypothetical protein
MLTLIHWNIRGRFHSGSNSLPGSLMTGLRAGSSGFDFRQGLGMDLLLFATGSRPTVRPTSPRIQLVAGVKWRSVKMITYLHLVPRLTMRRAIHPLTVFTKARHCTLSWVSPIQLTPSIPISLRSIFMLSSHLRIRASQPKPCKHLSSPLPS